MKKLLSLIAVCCAVSMGVSAMAHAVDAPTASPAKSAQPSKMKSCNAEAKGKKCNERKAFMKECPSK